MEKCKVLESTDPYVMIHCSELLDLLKESGKVPQMESRLEIAENRLNGLSQVYSEVLEALRKRNS